MTTTQDMDPELDALMRLRQSVANPKAWSRVGEAKAPEHTGSGAGCLNDHLISILGFADTNPCSAIYRRFTRMAVRQGYKSFYQLNDASTHTEVVTFVDDAIAARTAELAEKETA